jgi:hypothetical protein
VWEGDRVADEDVRETARLLSLAGASLRLRGVTNPEMHIFLASTPRLATIIIGSAPLSVEEVAKLRAATTELGFTVLVSPDQPTSSLVLAQVLQADTPEAFDRLVRSYHIDLTPPTDDRPFFLNQLIRFCSAEARANILDQGSLLTRRWREPDSNPRSRFRYSSSQGRLLSSPCLFAVPNEHTVRLERLFHRNN